VNPPVGSSLHEANHVAAKWMSIRYLSASHNGWLYVVAPTVSEIFHFAVLKLRHGSPRAEFVRQAEYVQCVRSDLWVISM